MIPSGIININGVCLLTFLISSKHNSVDTGFID
jgi:hypothetical protein